MLETENRNGIFVLTMCHGKVNAMDIEFCMALEKQFSDFASDPDCHAVVLASARKVFSAGVDLVRFVDENVDYVEPFLKSLVSSFRRIFEFPKPVVAAVNGAAIAGGCAIASASDRRLIAPDARIGIPELRVGVPFPTFALEIFRFVANSTSFQAMINSGQTYQDNSAITAGLADEVVSLSDLIPSAIETANRLAAVPPEVFTLTKQQSRLHVLRRAKMAEAEFGDAILRIWQSEELRQTVGQYVDKTLKAK